MEWLSKLDAILDSSLFRSRDDDDSSENETGDRILVEEEQSRNNVEFDYMAMEDTPVDESNISQKDEKPASRNQNDHMDDYDTDLTFTNPTKKEEIHVSQISTPVRKSLQRLPGMPRPVLRTHASDSSESDTSDEGDDGNGLFHDLEEKDRGNTPSIIETTVQGHVSPISSPRKGHEKMILLETINKSIDPSKLEAPSTNSFWNMMIAKSTDDMQLSEQEEDDDNNDNFHNAVEGTRHEQDDIIIHAEAEDLRNKLDTVPLCESSSQELQPCASPFTSPQSTDVLEKKNEPNNVLVENRVEQISGLFFKKDNDQRDDNVMHQITNSDDKNPPLVIETVQSMDMIQNISDASKLDQIKSHNSELEETTKIAILNRKSEDVRAAFGDFLPSYIYDDEDDGSSDMTELEGEDYNYGLIEPWEEDNAANPFDWSMNCHGVVHVRLLRMQNLPCSSGANIQPVINLPPWKGKIRFQAALAYRGPSNAGICVRWDRRALQEDDLSLDEENIHSPCISMVHTYNDEDTPVPNILIEIKDITIKMFESDLCSVRLSCAPLMSQPGIFRRRWCKMQLMKKSAAKEETTDTCPMILLEASFEPTDFGSSEPDHEPPEQVPLPELGSIIIHDDENLRSRCNTSETNNDHSSVAQSSVRTKSSLLTKKLSSKPHMFRNYAFLRPTSCALCDKLILWKLKGYQCEICGLDCCSDCQLRIDVEMPCGSREVQMNIENSLQSKISLSKFYDIIAPPKTAPTINGIRNEEETLDQKQSDKSSWKEGVGTMHLRIKQGCIYSENFPPEAEIQQILASGDRWLRKGDYYCRVSWTGSTRTKRTKIVFQTSKPKFDSDEMLITA